MIIDVKHVAKLANLKLTEGEEVKFERQLSNILSYVEKLNEIKTDGIEQTAQVTGLQNIKREDTTTQISLTQDETLKGAKDQHNGFFKVKAIFEDE